MPLRLCHAVYIVALYFSYFILLYVGVFIGHQIWPSPAFVNATMLPQIWIAGHPYGEEDYLDLVKPALLLSFFFASIFLAILVHAVLVSLVVIREFIVYEETRMYTSLSNDNLYNSESQTVASSVSLVPSLELKSSALSATVKTASRLDMELKQRESIQGSSLFLEDSYDPNNHDLNRESDM